MQHFQAVEEEEEHHRQPQDGGNCNFLHGIESLDSFSWDYN